MRKQESLFSNLFCYVSRVKFCFPFTVIVVRKNWASKVKLNIGNAKGFCTFVLISCNALVHYGPTFFDDR